MMWNTKTTIIILFIYLPVIYANHHLHALPLIAIDPADYPSADLILHDFRSQFHPTFSYRCLLQTESNYFYLDSTCQLLSRRSLKEVCPLNYTLKLEIVFPQNTTVYQLIVALKYKAPLEFNVTQGQPSITLPFHCDEQNEWKLSSKQTEFSIGNAHIYLHEEQHQQQHQQEKHCQFEKNPYRIKLKENELYQDFLQVKTIASCVSSNYLLASSNSKRNLEFFHLNVSTGYLSLLRPLDYESITSWKLVIQGHDKHHIPFYTYVIVDVDDVNDCPPLLSWNFPLQTIEIVNDTDLFNIRIAIHESKVEEKNVVIANLIASDLDASAIVNDQQATFQLKLNASHDLPFEIHGPFADATFVLSTNDKLDRELRDQYLLDLILTDNGQPALSSFYRLSIDVLDDNDNAPKFDKPIYYVDMQENNLVNTTLIQVFANDSDQAENGRVTYELAEKTSPLVFIDRQTGILRAKMSFDHEEMNNFTVHVFAIDHPKQGPPLRATATVSVKIVDQNDNIPRFPQSTYEFSIYENNAPHTYLGQVTAHDADGSPLTYALDYPSDEIASLFHISPLDGKLYVRNPLDREQFDHYTFHITASDSFHKSSRVKIIVKVFDVNDEIPRFSFPNEHNDTLIIDRTYWHIDDYICQIDIQDHDQIPNHTLQLIESFDQLKNFDYITEQKPASFEFDSSKFYLDDQAKLYFNRTNRTALTEGVYYLAFKIFDGQNYFDEKLLKLIVVNNYERIQAIVKQYDYLGSHLNNRLSYLQYHSTNPRSLQYQSRHSSYSSTLSSLDQSNKFLVFIVITVLSIILIGITFLFISLIKRKSFQQKEALKNQDSSSTSSGLQPPSDSSTMNLFKSSTLNSHDKRQNLRVSNCYDYNELSSPSSLLMLTKDSVTPTSLINDDCCLLDKLNEKELYDEQRNKTYTSWILSTANRPDSRYSQRSNDSSTFHSLNRLSMPSQIPSTGNLSHQLCSPKRHTNTNYESSSSSSTTTATSASNNSNLPPSSTPTEYTVAIVSSASTNISPHTPVSSDDGFCGSSDISDPPLTGGSNSLLSSHHHHHHHHYPQPYTMMKEGIILKSQRSPSFTSLFNHMNDASTLANGTDTTRRVRFNLEPDDKHQQRTILPLPTSNSPGRLADHALRRFEQLYMSRDNVLDKQSVDSALLYSNSTVV